MCTRNYLCHPVIFDVAAILPFAIVVLGLAASRNNPGLTTMHYITQKNEIILLTTSIGRTGRFHFHLLKYATETKLLGFLLQILVLRRLKPDMERYYVGTVLFSPNFVTYYF